ncbi:TPA: replication initiation protein [Vibrio cholerae]
MNNSVTKANCLIDASYRLNTQPQKLVLVCMSKMDLQPDIPISKEVTITALEFSEQMGIDVKNAHRELYKAADALLKSTISLRDENEDVEFYWLQKVSRKLKGQGSVTLTWSDGILKYINDFKDRVTTYKLQNIANLQSSHSIRIYELLMSFNYTGERVIYLEAFKSALGISDKYPLFKDLNKCVIKPSVEELNKKSDLIITCESIRKGRFVVGLEFSFKRKTPLSE